MQTAPRLFKIAFVSQRPNLTILFDEVESESSKAIDVRLAIGEDDEELEKIDVTESRQRKFSSSSWRPGEKSSMEGSLGSHRFADM